VAQYLYQTFGESVEKRVADLLQRMTLEEKVGQLCQVDGRTEFELWIKNKHVGSFLHVYGELINEIQKCASGTRLGIPILFGIDAIHGNAFVPGATVFPSQLALSSSWDVSLVEEMARITAKEVSVCGIHWTFSPVLCVSRDPRWGRIDETFGEDIFLIGEMGKAMVRGYQGKSLGDPYSILACAKHYAGYSETQGGRDASEADLSRRKLRMGFFPAFEAAAKEGCATFMIAYQAIDGIPCTMNGWLLNEVLKGEWKYEGITITDWNNIGRMVNEQFVCSTIDEAVSKAINSGTDMAMSTPDFPDALIRCVKEGAVSLSRIDESVRNILRLKFELGLFDGKKNVSEKNNILLTFRTEEHRKKALECALESIVLLKNENSIIPLKENVKRICVIGPNANDPKAQLGDWSAHSEVFGTDAQWHPEENIITVLQGIEERAGEKIVIEYCAGCSILDDEYDEIEKCVEIARRSDIAVIVVGDTLPLIGETHDRASLDLTGKQSDLINAIHETGTPIVTVLINSKPLSIPWVKLYSQAILEAWNPGMEGGTAIAKILFGDENPSGKLTISFPQHSGQIPVYYNQIPGWHAHKYADLPDDKPLFPFGFGLSFTSFRYDNLSTLKKEISKDENVVISVDIQNTGNYDGTEIAQLYIRDMVSSVTLPLRQLKSWNRISLAKGEQKKVEFVLSPEVFAFYNAECKKVIEPGVFEIMVGGSSRPEDLLKTTIVVIG
jgi:beta-glucosidase